MAFHTRNHAARRDTAVIATVRGNRAAVGYVTARPGDPAVRMAFTLPEDEAAP